MAKIAPYAFQQFLDNNGNPLSNGKVYTYEAGTSTNKTTYSDASGTIANANPVVLDSAGRADIWLGNGAYKFVLKTSADAEIATVDDITGDSPNAFGSSVTTISGNLSVTSAYKNSVILVTATSTISLPAVSGTEDGFYFVVKNTSASSIVTIDPYLSETIDGASTIAIQSGGSAVIIFNGTGWTSLFLDSDVIQASGTNGVLIKNSAGTTIATLGASATTASTFAGNTTVQGLLAVQGVTYTTGRIEVAGNSTAAGYIKLFEDTDNGTNAVTVTPPQSIASDYTVTLPDTAGTLVNTAFSGLAKAWVSFNGTGTVAIRGSYNVSSITDNGTGDYTVNFTTPFSNANYAAAMICGQGATGNNYNIVQIHDTVAPTASAFRVQTKAQSAGTPTAFDMPYVMLIFFGD